MAPLRSSKGLPLPSDFERRCLEHVRRTAEYLGALGLDAEVSAAPQRLVRCVGLDAAGADEPPTKRWRPSDAGGSGSDEAPTEGHDDEETQVVEASRRWLQRSRAAIIAPGLGGSEPTTAETWRAEALRRWGDAVPEQGAIGDWATYVRSRLPRPPPPSPLDLMQERYAYDAWRLLAACTLMARISSERVKTETIAVFFALVPSPSMMLAIEAGKACQVGKEDLRAALKPLGLVDNRIKTLVELSKAFLQMPSFECGLQKGANKIWGCGAFAVDSYLMFCRGVRLLTVADASCQGYLEWWRSEFPELLQQQEEETGKTPPRPPRRAAAPAPMEAGSPEKPATPAALGTAAMAQRRGGRRGAAAGEGGQQEADPAKQPAVHGGRAAESSAAAGSSGGPADTGRQTGLHSFFKARGAAVGGIGNAPQASVA